MYGEAFDVSETGFPDGFAWGTATAAYQIEGAIAEDGKGESIWDRFSHTPGIIDDGSTGDIACDHYHRWQEDIDLIAGLNLNAYRFSMAWSRVLPEGHGKLNAAGLDFYDRLVEGLLARGITPYITLYHWDLPQALQDRGGWENRDTAYYFGDFAEAAAQRLGDRVKHWITLNEPQVVVFEGYSNATKAPGKRDRSLLVPVAHHLLLAHGIAVQVLRTETPPDSEVGITLNINYIEPATDREEDVAAARLLDEMHNRWFLDPIYSGTYPEDAAEVLGLSPDMIRMGEMETINNPLNFLGVNYYSRTRVKAGPGGAKDPKAVPPSGALTTMGWEVYPQGLRNVLTRVHKDYAFPKLYVTENGAAYPDTVDAQGEVHDPERARYLREHFSEARAAIADGVPLEGYFVWSLMDNFEWKRGYVPRFGVVYTDYPTQRRIVKDSGKLLARVAATNGGALDEG
jgi:beta-glucosidase